MVVEEEKFVPSGDCLICSSVPIPLIFWKIGDHPQSSMPLIILTSSSKIFVNLYDKSNKATFCVELLPDFVLTEEIIDTNSCTVSFIEGGSQWSIFLISWKSLSAMVIWS